MNNEEEQKHDKEHEHEIVVFVNNHEFTTDEHELTGLQIKELGGVPADYELFLIRGEDTIPIGNEEKVKLENKIHFRAIPAGTFGTPWHFHRA